MRPSSSLPSDQARRPSGQARRPPDQAKRPSDQEECDARERELALLTDEVARLRTELFTSRATSARALARATRLAQLVSVLGQLTDVTDVLDHAVCEVAEQFSSDIAVVLMPDPGRGGGLRLAAQWGIAAKHLPQGGSPCPVGEDQLTAASPVLAGQAEDFTLPEWLAVTQPRHVACGLLNGRLDDLGYLLLTRRADEPFEPADVHELVAVVSRISLTVDNGLLYRRSQVQLHRLQRLHEITAALAGIVDLDRAVRAIAEILVTEVPLTGAAVYLARDDGSALAGVAGSPEDPPSWIARHEVLDRPGTTVLNLGAGVSRVGTLLVNGGPSLDTDAGSFLSHLADVGGLVLEKALLFERIRAQAQTDALTGLPNRPLFMERLASALTRCRTMESDLAVIFIDLDGFKGVNDTYGHDAGDDLLVQVARRLVDAVRPPDLTARLGGDEFVVLCEDVDAVDLGEVVVGRVQQALDAPYHLDRQGRVVEVRIGGSIGVALAGDVAYRASALLRAADAAMYAAKQSRRPDR